MSVWVFLAVGVPLIDDVKVLGGYTFSYSLRYLITITIVMLPVYFIILIKNYNRKFVTVDIREIKVGRILFYFLWISIFLGLALYYLQYGVPPLLKASSVMGNSSGIYELRMGATYSDGYKSFKLYFVELPLLCVLIGHTLYLMRKLTWSANVISIVLSLGVSFLFLLKSDSAIIILSLFVLSMSLRPAGLKVAVLAVVGFFMILMSSYFFYMGGVGATEILTLIVKRIVIPYAVSLDYTITSFPEIHPFFEGAAFPNPGGIFDFQPVYYSNFLMQVIAGRADGTIPAPSVAFVYANFGYVGALFFSAFMFSFFVFLYQIHQRSKNILMFVLWLILSISVFRFNIQDPFSAFQFYFFIASGFLLFIGTLRNTGKIRS